MLFKVKQRAKTNYFDKVIEKNATLSVPTELKGDGLGASLGKRKGKKQKSVGILRIVEHSMLKYSNSYLWRKK